MMKRHWLRLCLILLLFTSFNFQSVQAATVHTYVPIGFPKSGRRLRGMGHEPPWFLTSPGDSAWHIPGNVLFVYHSN